MNTNKKSSFNMRSFTAILLFFSFVLLPPSGILLHFTDHLETDNLLRHLAMSLHNVSSLVFLISGVVHVITNWKSMKRYAVSQTGNYLSFKKEMIIALAIMVGLIVLLSTHVFHLG